MQSTLLFAQQGMKAAVLTEDCITVHYVDGSAPLHINSDDCMYQFHRKQFDGLIDQNLDTLKPETTPDKGEEVPAGPTLVK